MYKYSTKNADENAVKASGISLPISTKISVEVCNFIRGKKLQKAKKMLEEVINKKLAVPYKRYNQEIPHRKGKIATGRFPKKASYEILRLLKSVEANAQFKGLNTGNLVIKHICSHKASRPMHTGRHRRRLMKRTHIEVLVEETKEKVKEKEIRKEAIKSKPKEKKEEISDVKKEQSKEKNKQEEKKDEEKKAVKSEKK